MLRSILLILVLGIIIGCSTEQQASDSSQSGTAEPQTITSKSTPTEAPEERSVNLVFFLDPNGGPCKKQNNILQGISDELSRKVNIRYVSTTVQDQRQLFYHYGIRALPTLLLADSQGKEIKRLTPGIKNIAEIRSFLQSVDEG